MFFENIFLLKISQETAIIKQAYPIFLKNRVLLNLKTKWQNTKFDRQHSHCELISGINRPIILNS